MNQMDTSETRCLELQFTKKLAPAVLTGQNIKAVELVLVDSLTKKVVDSEPGASAKVEICALKGDFGDVQGGNWTSEQFDENIVTERGDIPVKNHESPAKKRKWPLLKGNKLLNLNRGKCHVQKIAFRQYATWMKLSKFKLGARIPCTLSGVRIKEAVSDQFTVEDRRNQLYTKRHPPFLNDEVWRLEKIGRNGAFHKRLSKENVYYVKDFLTLLYLEPTRLRNILGTSMSAKVWDATVNHARTCELDNKLYLYHSSGSQQKKVVVFNVVGRVMGLFSNNQLISSEKLSATDKADAHGLVLSAFKHWDKVVSVDDEASLMHAYCSLPTLDYLNPRLVANFENNKSLAANTYGFGDNLGFTSSSTARMEGQFSIDDEASSNTDSSSNPPVMANFDGHKISTANANCNGENPELSSSLTAQMEGWSSVDDEASLILVPYCLPTVDYFSNPPVMANFDGNKSLSAGTFDNGDYPELSSSSTAQVEGVFSSDDYSRKNDLDFGNDQPSSNSILDIDSKIQVLLEDEMLRKFNPDYNHLHSSIFRSLNEPQCVLSGALKHPVPPSKGHRRWKMLLSAVRKISLGN